jgi:tight adherence protein C
MEIMIALGTFVSVTLLVYGLGYRGANTGSLDARLGGLRYSRGNRESLHDPEAAFTARVWTPLVSGAVRRANSILPSSFAERMEGAITRAGLKMSAGQFIVLTAVTGGVVPLLLLALFAMGGSSGKSLILMYLVLVFMGARAKALARQPQKRRQKEIWKALPDAFDLITASVEAGLGIDAAFTRVIEKVRGPFADELTRSMREITMGRSRREAFMEMADRTGVDEPGPS